MRRVNGIAQFRSMLLWQVLVSGVLLLPLVGCGGGGGSPPPPPPPPDFSLAVSPTMQTLTAGSSVAVSLSATALNGFTSQISVQVTGQQGGVSPQSFTITPGTPQSITFTAAVNTPTSSVTVNLAGSSSSLAHTSHLAILDAYINTAKDQQAKGKTPSYWGGIQGLHMVL
jgi:hypothetical protein